jgi:hypothetical protein
MNKISLSLLSVSIIVPRLVDFPQLIPDSSREKYTPSSHLLRPSEKVLSLHLDRRVFEIVSHLLEDIAA